MMFYTSLLATEVVCVAKNIGSEELHKGGAHFHFGSLKTEKSQSLRWDLGPKIGTAIVTKYAIPGTGYRAIEIGSKSGFISPQGYGDIEFAYGEGHFDKGACIIYTTATSEIEEGEENPKLF